MSTAAFWQMARLSLTAGWMILILLALRPLLKRVPRKYSCMLWGLVALRLMFPFSLKSRVSMVPQAAAAPRQMVTALAPMQPAAAPLPALPADALPAAAQAAGGSGVALLPLLWALGFAAMVVYAAVSYLRLRRRVRICAPAGKGIYRCDHIRTPFILGVIRPKIYLPSTLDDATAPSVLAHERAHLRRGDHLWKPLGYLLLSIHWFNPLCWVAYLLFCRDVEQACDQAVIRTMTTQQRQGYSAALLACALPHPARVCPLAFAEVGVKQRIAGVLSYRKPKFWVTILAVVLCIALAAVLLTDPVQAEGKSDAATNQPFLASGVTAVLSENVNVRRTPSDDARIVALLKKGQQVQIVRTDFVRGDSWTFVQSSQDQPDGWVRSQYLILPEGTTLPENTAAEPTVPESSGPTLAPGTQEAAEEYFQYYIKACGQPTPEKAEDFLYFASDYSREFFRDNYAPITHWAISNVSQLSDVLWCITWGDSRYTDYAFVGQLGDRLYVFRTVRELPEQWQQGLDVSQYEDPNAMYMTPELLECYSVTKNLMAFAQPTNVKIIQKSGWAPDSEAMQLDFADAVCGTDTWRYVEEAPQGDPQCIVQLTAQDGKTARIWDVDGTILITYPDGTQKFCRATYQGEDTYPGSTLLDSIYRWSE